MRRRFNSGYNKASPPPDEPAKVANLIDLEEVDKQLPDADPAVDDVYDDGNLNIKAKPLH